MTLKKVRDQYGKAKFIQVEQDHRFIKKRVRSMLGLKSFRTATPIISGIEAMHMVKKGQLILLDKSVQNQVKFIHQLFGIVA
ncbi:DDE-type integrase/transposase/recombinase [Bacillus mycoides]|uniref:DDE-type integrase/transposase/recombinase n=1 Tax=Bacillus mycoides TaxID=1405 RepID=UPI0036E3528C